MVMLVEQTQVAAEPQQAAGAFYFVEGLGPRLQVSRSTLLRWDDLGLIPGRVKLGPGGKGRRRWLREQVERWIATGCPMQVTPPQPVATAG